MKPLNTLTYLGQVRRLRKLATSALTQYALDEPSLKLLQHAENTTYRLDAVEDDLASSSDLFAPGRYLLRVHRDGYHDEAEIRAEMAWLAALRVDLGLAVPEPVLTREGEPLALAAAPGSDEFRHVTVLRWMDGRLWHRDPKPEHLRLVGEVMAKLHQHVRTWQPPTGFKRGHWDWEGLFGEASGWYNSAEETWALLPEPIRSDSRVVADEMADAMQTLGKGPDAYGLLHADLHLGNVLFCRTAAGETQARVLDFDDSGFGHWIYDLATAVAYNTDDDDFAALRDAMLAGYASVAPLPEDQLPYLNLFIAGRYVSIMLWAADMATQKPNIADSVARWQSAMHKDVRAYLDGEGWAAESA